MRKMEASVDPRGQRGGAQKLGERTRSREILVLFKDDGRVPEGEVPLDRVAGEVPHPLEHVSIRVPYSGPRVNVRRLRRQRRSRPGRTPFQGRINKRWPQKKIHRESEERERVRERETGRDRERGRADRARI